MQCCGCCTILLRAIVLLGVVGWAKEDAFEFNMARLKVMTEKKAVPEVKLVEASGRRNHGCTVVDGQVVSILGRWAESVESGSTLRECKGDGTLCVLNHVVAVPLKNEIFVPCGFENHHVGRETSTRRARIVDPVTLEVSWGPELDVPGGACAAVALEDKKTVCAFGGTDGSHDDGEFLDSVRCYDAEAKKWSQPFDNLPAGLDHANAVRVDAGTCGDSPPQVLVMNFRTQHYDNMRTEVFSLNLDDGKWRLASNDTSSLPRDASGAILLNKQFAVQFGGVYYCYAKTQVLLHEAKNLLSQLCVRIGCTCEGPIHSKRRGFHLRVDFSEIRAYDVCRQRWFHVARMAHPVFATQSCATANMTYTCGGRSGGRKTAFSEPTAFVGGDGQNTRDCDVRIHSELDLMIKAAISRSTLKTARRKYQQTTSSVSDLQPDSSRWSNLGHRALLSTDPRRDYDDESVSVSALQREIFARFGRRHQGKIFSNL